MHWSIDFGSSAIAKDRSLGQRLSQRLGAVGRWLRDDLHLSGPENAELWPLQELDIDPWEDPAT